MKNNYPELKNGVILKKTLETGNLRLIHNVMESFPEVISSTKLIRPRSVSGIISAAVDKARCT
jgi:hypothetical protein